MRKALPDGAWVAFGGIAPETTDEELQAYLLKAGIELPLERISISVGKGGTGALAIVSLPRSEIVELVRRAIGSEKLRGHSLNPYAPPGAR